MPLGARKLTDTVIVQEFSEMGTNSTIPEFLRPLKDSHTMPLGNEVTLLFARQLNVRPRTSSFHSLSLAEINSTDLSQGDQRGICGRSVNLSRAIVSENGSDNDAYKVIVRPFTWEDIANIELDAGGTKFGALLDFE
mmetsp:Transcript_2809/g.4250  ORF Transcript_2809/g.4250 Transcript_2809/m.4250 type:complete len:137 (-) Transcript_2809:1401-1811(-)